MRYYNYKHQEMMQSNKMDEVLQKYFPTNDFGACVIVVDWKVENIEINKCRDEDDGHTTWEHYANVNNVGSDLWEVNTQFNGENKDEMWIYGYYHRFGDAVRRVARDYSLTKSNDY